MTKGIIQQIKGIIRFIIDDFKRDFAFIGRVIEGKFKPKIDKNKVKELLDIESFFKENWMLFIMVAFAFVCGVFYGSQYYQDKCNLYVQEQILPQCNLPLSFEDRILINLSEEVDKTSSPNRKWLDNAREKIGIG